MRCCAAAAPALLLAAADSVRALCPSASLTLPSPPIPACPSLYRLPVCPSGSVPLAVPLQAEKLRDYAFLLGYKKADVTFGVASVSEEATKKGADGKAVQGADGKDEKVVKPLDAFEVSVHQVRRRDEMLCAPPLDAVEVSGFNAACPCR